MAETMQSFLGRAPGKYFNPDGMYGFQCKDLIDSYCEAIFGKPWSQTITPGNANQVFNTASGEYFEKILNNPNDPNMVPRYGDIITWAGDGHNQFGHIAVVISADVHGVNVVQQDGYLQSAAFQGRLGYTQAGTGMVQGWLRPKANKMVGAAKPAVVAGKPAAAKTVTLPASAGKWNVYREGGPYTTGNQIGALNPSLFGGLAYQILGWKAGNTVAIIQTRDFGRCGIYVANGTGAVIK